METAKKYNRSVRSTMPVPPPKQAVPIIHGDSAAIHPWLDHYWQKLQISSDEFALLAITQDRQEYRRWTGKRLNLMTLGCYCYLPALSRGGAHRTRSEAQETPHRHLIFIESDMQPKSLEVTVAHELIHLADRVKGMPRKHHHHGYDAIAADEAAITGYGLEELRALLREESARREQKRRERRPIRYLYACPHCGKKYPRTRKYSQAVSCSDCDKHYNPRFRLLLELL
jgi:hypothetical protein